MERKREEGASSWSVALGLSAILYIIGDDLFKIEGSNGF